MSLIFENNYIENLKLLSILYVEDDPEIQSIVLNILKEHFKTIYTADNGNDGLRFFKEHNPDIIITGIQMPKMNGLELIHEMKKLHPDIPVIILTSENDEGYFLQAIDLGVDKYIKKPVDEIQLLASLNFIASSLFQKKEIKVKNEIINAVLDSHPDLMMICQGRNIHYMNISFKLFIDYNSQDVYGQELSLIDPFLAFSSNSIYHGATFYEIIQYSSRPESSGDTIIYLKNMENASVNAYLLHTKPIPDFPEILVTLTDVTDMENEKQFFHELAMRDPLTGAFNRNQFNESLRHEIERSHRYKHPLSLILLDIDYFKKFNDRYGHPVGDKILIYLTELVQDNIRLIDTFARYGGEEFIILLPETAIEKSYLLAENLRKLIENDSQNTKDCPETITCSFGVTQMKENDTPDIMIKRVDTALYKAKNSGRNKVIIG